MLRFLLCFFACAASLALFVAPVAASVPSPSPESATQATAAPGSPAPSEPTTVPSSAPPAPNVPLLEGPSSAPAPSATPSVDEVTVRAMDWLRRLRTGQIDRTQLTVELSRQLSPERVKSAQADFAQLGKLLSSKYTHQDESHGLHGYYYLVVFTRAKYLYLFETNTKDEVAGLSLFPIK